MANWQQEYLDMIWDCECRESKLTDWERGFIDSISQWIEGGKPLTERQAETLDSIWERVTEGGEYR